MSRRGSKRAHGDDITGLLLLDKPAGVSSNGALQQAKRLLNAQKAGHTGSLDPIATGLLPLCFGDATKISACFLGADKSYWTRVRLGQVTTTADKEGTVISERPVDVDEAKIEQALAAFVGQQMQTPPMYSAVKVNGQPLYKLARQGIEIERKPREVTVYSLQVCDFAPPFVDFKLKCSSGFYVRTLAQDLGEALGCGGHVVELRRTEVGPHDVKQAVRLDLIETIEDIAERQKLLIRTDDALPHYAEVNLSMDAAFYLCRGQSVRAGGLPDAGATVRLYAQGGGFLGLGEVTDDGRVAPKRLFAVKNVSANSLRSGSGRTAAART